MGDMEFDAMDDIDYSEDFDSGMPENGEHVTDAAERSMSETDAVAAILRGEDPGDYKAKPNDSGARTRNLDSHGRVDYGSNDSPAPAQKDDALSSQERLYTADHNAARENIQQAEQWINSERQKAQNDYEEGRTTYEEFQQREFQLGGAYGQLTMQAKDWEINQYKLEKQRDASYKQLEERLGDRWSPENRGETAQQARDWLESRGITREQMDEIEEPEVAATIIEAMDAIQKNDSLKDEVAQLKAQVRNLKRMRNEGRKRGQRASQAGVTGDKQTDMINEVAALLAGESNTKGGRR